jgi:hypothetical protein
VESPARSSWNGRPDPHGISGQMNVENALQRNLGLESRAVALSRRLHSCLSFRSEED